MTANSLSALPTDRPRTAQRIIALGVIFVLTFAGLAAAQLLRFIIGGSLALDSGDVARIDIRAPQRIEYVSDLETKRQQDLAEASVAPIFTPLDGQVARQQIIAARGVLDQIVLARQNEGDSASRARSMMQLQPLEFDEATALRIVTYSDASWARIDSQIITVLDTAMRAPIRPDNLEQAKRSVRQQISLSLNKDDAELVERIASALLVPNTNFDEVATNAARAAARESVKPVVRVFETNQIILRSGQIIGPADIEALDKLNIRRPTLNAADLINALLMTAVSLALAALALLRNTGSIDRLPLRNLGLSAAALTFSVLMSRWLLPGHGLLPYLAPIVAVGIAVSAWSGMLPGVVASLVAGTLIGQAMDKPIEFTIVFALGGAAASMVLGRATRLSDYIRAGIAAGVLQACIVLAFNSGMAQRPAEVPQLITYIIGSVASGVIASGLALGALYLSSLVFDVTTVVQLIDLARPSHPLIQKLLLQAPGTYHHSLMVGNLAEQAAERIGADSLLSRVGAYYHDIGKIENPHHFIENQIEGVNIHDRLDPRTSASLLHSHVTNGLQMAKKYRLPFRIRTFIAEHHGTMRANYQYNRACRESDKPVDEAPFRYPGPRPQSRETALLMLADASEATVRASKCETDEAMDAVIRRTISDRLADHQLDASGLTLSDLEAIRRSFLETLRGIYHPRVEYPNTQRAPLALGEAQDPGAESPTATANA